MTDDKMIESLNSPCHPLTLSPFHAKTLSDILDWRQYNFEAIMLLEGSEGGLPFADGQDR